MMIEEHISGATIGAVKTLLAALYARIPLKLWAICAVDGEDWRVIHMHDTNSGISRRQLLGWQADFRYEIDRINNRQLLPAAAGELPESGAPVYEVPRRRPAALDETRTDVLVKAYIGIPLYDGTRLLGTLCGADREPDVAGVRHADGLVRQTANLISRLLTMEAHVNTQRMMAGDRSDATRRDALTGLLNRRGWDSVIRQTRGQFGTHVNGVIVVELWGLQKTNKQTGVDAADRLAKTTTASLTNTMREHDVVARLGLGSFGVLLRCDSAAMVPLIVARVEQGLIRDGVTAVSGHALSPPEPSLDAAFITAHRIMVANKQRAAAPAAV